MEYFNHSVSTQPVRAILFDFDGTVSTLRSGWEKTMKPLMLEMISGGTWGLELEAQVDAYIDESTGIQTIHQMKWLAEQVKLHCRTDLPEDPWWYKAEYNRRLMQSVSARLAALENGSLPREACLIGGSEAFLADMKKRGVKLYVASGTDHPDVLREAHALGVDRYFDAISGAPVAAENCSKEKVLKQLIETEGLKGADVAVIGDGKVEIALGKAAGARTVGLATDEDKLRGVNPVKRERLIRAGADVITGDFEDTDALLTFLGLA